MENWGRGMEAILLLLCNLEGAPNDQPNSGYRENGEAS
jgi:hypothetical protein